MTNLATLPNIAHAKLPAAYEQAKAALVTCYRIDECADWANKAEAIASYARQSADETLMETAMRIKARAIERCGELMKEFSDPDKPNGGRPKNGGGAPPVSVIARNAGLSRDQMKQALRVASVPKAEFERLVEASPPATVTELAKRGTKASPAHLQGRDARDFALSTQGQGRLRFFVEESAKYDPVIVVRGAVPREYPKMRANARAAIAWIRKLQRALKGKRA